MRALIIQLFNLSLTAGWLVLAVLLLRKLLHKAPKWTRCWLWLLVGLRLVFPFSVESALSLIPSAEPLPQSIATATTPAIDSGFEVIDRVVNPVLSNTMAPQAGARLSPMQMLLDVAGIVWAVGVACMLLAGVVSYIRLSRRVRASICLGGRLYACDDVDSPFIFGIFKPRIYVPSGLPAEQTEYVLAHEQAHLRRGDHLIKPLGYLLLAVYWFQPLLWLAYVLLCRDIELACDERVVRDMDVDARRGYSEALVSCSTHRRLIAVCPLAFGEVGVKERVRRVLYYKKPAFWIIVLAVLACIATAVCFLTAPARNTARYADRVLRVEVTHTHGTVSDPSYPVYYNIDSTQTFALPYESGNYNVSFTVTDMTKEGLTLRFSREMDLWSEDGYGGTVIEALLPRDGELRVSTPTDGGGENYAFSLVKGDVSLIGGADGPDAVIGSPSGNGGALHRLPQIVGDVKSGIVIGSYGSTIDGVSIALEIGTYKEGYTFDICRSNGSGQSVEYGEPFYIYRYEDGEWVKLEPRSNIAWTMPLYFIEPGGIYTHSYALTYCYDILSEPGSYRFEADDVWVEFSVVQAVQFSGAAVTHPEYCSASCDIDGDGTVEQISVAMGPTSGLFSFCVRAYDPQTEETEYSSLFYGPLMEFEFVQRDGATLLQGSTRGGERYLYALSVEGEMILLTGVDEK